MSKGNVRKFTKSKGYESLDRSMLQDEENLSIESIGLLANLTSYSDDWEVHKTELYKRFAKSGRRKIERAWNELIAERYIVQLRRRKGSKWEYIYYHSQTKFTDEDIELIEEQEGCKIWDGKISSSSSKQEKEVEQVQEDDGSNVPSTVHNAQSKEESFSNVHSVQYKMDSTGCTDKRLTTDEVYYKDKELDILDTEDTGIPDLSTEKITMSLTDQEREKKKKKYEENAFYKNDDHVPERIARMLKVYSKTIEEAEAYYKIIMTAKKKAEKDINPDEIIWFEHEPELVHKIVDAFVRSVRKIEREFVSNPSGYIYTAIYDLIIKEKGDTILSSNKNLESKHNHLSDMSKEIMYMITGKDV